MGWLSSDRWQTKKDITDHLKSQGLGESRTVGNVFYGLAESGTIIICLLRKERGYGWGYKDMSESMGVYEATCPDSLLDLAGPAPNEYAAKWREQCRAYNAAERARKALLRSLKVGDTVVLSPGCSPSKLRLVAVGSKMVGVSEEGLRFNVPARYIDHVEAA